MTTAETQRAMLAMIRDRIGDYDVDKVVAPTYRIVRGAKSGTVGIECLRCGMTSYHPTDVQERYCGNCHVFHETE